MKKLLLSLVILCTLVVPAYSGTNYCIDSNTKAAYKLDETSGTISDCTSNANNSTSTSGVTYNVTGQWSGAVSFSNASNQTIQFAAASSINNINPITVCAWVARKGAAASTGNISDDGTIISKQYRSWALSLHTTGQIRWTVHYSGGTANWDTTNGAITGTGFHHVCVVHNRTNGSTPSIYVDGTLQTTNSNSTDATIDNDSSDSMQLGTADGLNTDRIQAYIDDVLIYGGSFSSTDVTNEKNCGIDGSHCASGNTSSGFFQLL